MCPHSTIASAGGYLSHTVKCPCQTVSERMGRDEGQGVEARGPMAVENGQERASGGGKLTLNINVKEKKDRSSYKKGKKQVENPPIKLSILKV